MSTHPIIAAFLAVNAGDGTSPTDAAEKAAVESAKSWLKLVDDGNYAESWNEASESFRSAVKKEQWPQMLTAVRKPLGGDANTRQRRQVEGVGLLHQIAIELDCDASLRTGYDSLPLLAFGALAFPRR